MSKSKNEYLDIFTSFFFILGVYSFFLGEFVVSTILFGLATLISLLDFDCYDIP